MSLKSIERILSALPDSPKKRKLMEKYQQLQKNNSKSTKRGGDGLKDSFELQPKGHIKIEAINEHGEVVDTLADQPNLVVDGAEEILLRAFSGDPNRILYKNRTPKAVTTGKIHIDNSLLNGKNLFDNGQLQHAPNVLWSAVDDEEFEISYGYYPIVVYVKEEVSTEFNKKAFVISKEPGAGFVPLNAEVYSTSTNMFIGIGEGKNYPVDLNSGILSYSEGFEPSEGKASTTTEGHEVSLREKISNFSLEFEASNEGAQIDVFINGALQETIETLDSGLEAPEVRRFDYDGLNPEEETEVKIVHSGSDSGVSNPVMSIVGIHIDALNENMNGLIQEFENFEVDFKTPTVFNTTPMGPYTIQLPYYPLVKGSVEVTYNDVNFQEVETEEQLHDTAFVVDDIHGILQFNRALTGVFVSYSVTGEIYDTELVTSMISEDVVDVIESNVPVTGETLAGQTDGANKLFTVSHKPIIEGSISLFKDGVAIQESEIQNIDLGNGRVTLVQAPDAGEEITANYTYLEVTEDKKASNTYVVEHPINEGTLRILDQEGNALTEVDNEKDFGQGTFLIKGEGELENRIVHISAQNANGESITKIEAIYASDEKPGVPTNYTRAIIEKPKTVNEYPWFELDKGSVRFVADFPELKPVHNITIREMGLFDGPRAEDNIAGFTNFPVKAFSLVRVGDTRKDLNTGIRITWTITLLNNEGQPFQGGNN